MVHARRRQRGDFLGELQGRRVRGLEEQVVVGQFAHLPGGRLDQLLAAVADVDAPEPGHAIEDLVALAVPQVHALGAGHDARALAVERLEVGKGRQVVVAAQGLPVFGLFAHRVDTFLQAPRRSIATYTEKSRNSRSQELITRL